jgi:hypothetical protein
MGDHDGRIDRMKAQKMQPGGWALAGAKPNLPGEPMGEPQSV